MRCGTLLSVLLLTILIFSIAPRVSGDEEGSADVNIERYIEFRIEFDHGEKLHLEARIEASPFPVDVFLIKGEEPYGDWVESEDVSVSEILDGKNVSGINVTFQVIENFSQSNTTSFDSEIDIGERDTYFLIIALHRDSKMTPEEVMSMASGVDYTVDWSIENREFPWAIMIVALVLFLVGVFLIIVYVIGRRRSQDGVNDGYTTGGGPGPGRSGETGKGRAPPMHR